MKTTPEIEKQLDTINAVSHWTCHECKENLHKNYCGACDGTYMSGHKPGCSQEHNCPRAYQR